MRLSSSRNVLRIGFVLLGALATVGCWNSSPVAKTAAPVPPPSAAEEQVSQDSNSSPSNASPEAAAGANSQTNTPAEKTPPDTASKTDQPGEVADPAASEPENTEPVVPVDPIAAAGLEGFPRERVLLFTAASPLVIEIIPVIDGESHTAVLKQMVDEALKIADTDGDGRVKWDELAANRHFKYGQFGNVAIADERNKRQFIQTYDINSDGYVDREEVPRLLTRNAGGARSFSIRGGGFSPDQNESASFNLLDTDRSGELDENEIAAAATLLRQHDRNLDDYIAANELQPEMPDSQMPVDPSQMMVSRRRRGDAPDLVRLMYSNAPWEVIQGNLESAYALGGRLDADSFPMFPDFFKAMDKDGDGKVKRGEISGLLSLPAHIVIAVRMGQDKPPPASVTPPLSAPPSTETEKPEVPKTESENASAENAASATSPPEKSETPPPAADQTSETPSAERAPVAAAAESSPVTDAAPQDAAPKVERPTIQVLYVDPTLLIEPTLPPEANRVRLALKTGLLDLYANDFVGNQSPAEQAKQALMMADADKNGYLEASEITGGSVLMRIEAVDENEDGKAYPDEIERFFHHRMGAQRAQIHARADYRDDAVLAWLDTNRDDRLDHLELRGLADRIKQLDKNGDGMVGRDELPDNLYFVLARGDLQNPGVLFALPAPRVVDNSGERPRWFTKMDLNRDGVINRREFLGELDQFNQLDKDGDGALSWGELKDAK